MKKEEKGTYSLQTNIQVLIKLNNFIFIDDNIELNFHLNSTSFPPTSGTTSPRGFYMFAKDKLERQNPDQKQILLTNSEKENVINKETP